MEEEKKTNRPLASVADRNISAGIFASAKGFSISFQRSYLRKGETDYTRETIHFYDDDLLRASELLREAYLICRENWDVVKKLREEEKNQQTNDNVPF